MVFKWRNKGQAPTQPEGVTTGVEVGEAAATEADLAQFRKSHKWDPFLDIQKLDDVDDVLQSGDVEKEAAVKETLIEEDSPYPEVRASVGRRCIMFLFRL